MAQSGSGEDRTVLLPQKGPGDPWPARIGGHEVLRRIGEGGMGMVLLARDPELHRDVAIKLVRPELLGNSIFVERFFREARLSAKLNHPNIVTTYQCGKEGDTPYLVLEFVDGPTLKELMQTPPPLSLGRVLDLFVQCCDGLEAASKKGVVHRDFKPANVMVTRDGVAKLMDFGLAKELRGDSTSMATAVLGTPEYMSPEQARAERVDFRTDVYAMGISLFQCATGYLPFKESSAFETIKAHTERPMPEDARLRTVAGGRLADLVLRMTAKASADRPQSYAEIRAELLAIRAEAGEAAEKPLAFAPPSADRPTPARKTPSGQRRSSSSRAKKAPAGSRAAAAGLVAIGLAAALGGGAWMALRGNTSSKQPAVAATPVATPTPAPTAEPGITLRVDRAGTAADLLRELGNMGANLAVAPDLDAKRIAVNARFSNRSAEDILAATAIVCGWDVEQGAGVTDIRRSETVPLPEFDAARERLAPEDLPVVGVNTVGRQSTLRLFCEALAVDKGVDYLLAGTGVGDAPLPSVSLSNAPLSAVMDTFVERGVPIRWSYVRGTLIVVPKQ